MTDLKLTDIEWLENLIGLFKDRMNEYTLQHFQQIKTKLEAWYEIKNLYLKGYFSRVELPTESDKKFKKALEVEDDK